MILLSSHFIIFVKIRKKELIRLCNEEILENIQNQIIKQISENMKSYGFAGTIGHVIAVMHYEEKPMNLDELAEKTGMSKTRMSQVLREMVRLNIAEKVFVKGSRKDTYTVEKDYYQTFISLFTHNWKNVVIRNKKIDERIIEEISAVLNDENATEEQKRKAKLYYEDTKQSLEFFDWVDRLVEFFDSQQIMEHIPKETPKKLD